MIASLESLCAIPAVIAISNLPEVKKQVFSFSSISSLKIPPEYEEWKDSLKEIVRKILKEFIRIVPLHLFPLIGFEMIKWAKMLKFKFELNFKFTENFISCKIFSSNGTIDDCKAARDLVMENSLNLFLRFKIACYYFLEDIIPDLWEKLHNGSTNIEEACEEYKSDGSVILWAQYLNAKHALTFTTSKKFEPFSEKVISYAFRKMNLEGIKFYFKSKKFSSFFESEERRHLFFRYFAHLPETFEKSKNFSLDILLSSEFKNYFVILIFLFQQAENKKIISRRNVGFNFLKGLLFWPFQDLFKRNLYSLFNYLEKKKCYLLMHTIVDLIDNEYLGKSYNYRLLLREFWISSPSGYKKYFLDVESRVEYFDFCSDRKFSRTIVTKLFMLDEFTDDDEDNFLLILKNANKIQKEGIAEFYFDKVCIYKPIPIGKLELLNMFIENLFLSDSDRSKYKEKIALHQIKRVLTNEKNFDLADQIVNWATDPKGIENLKTKIFSESFKFHEVTKLYIDGVFSLAYIDKVLKWSLHSDDKILEWKKKGVLPEYFCKRFISSEENDLKSFEMFLNWLSHPSDKIINIKQEMIRYTFPLYVESMINPSLLTKYNKTVLFLCSYNNELLAKFINDLSEFCTRYCEGYFCRLCIEMKRFYGEPGKPRLHCIFHERPGASFKETYDAVMSSNSKELFDLLSKHESGME